MPVRCPECQTENRPGARACEFCNAVLPQAGPQGLAPDPDALRRRTEAERRLKSGRRLSRILVPLLSLLAVVLIALIIVLFPRLGKTEGAPDLILDYPSVAIDRYYTALEEQDYATAGDLLAGSLRSQVPAGGFERLYVDRPIDSHSLKDLGQVDEGNAYAAVSINGQPGFVWLVMEEQGWRIAWTPELGESLGIPCPV
ncbi:MAG: hypothetical protein GF320_22760 [Armatimonadia bacterium]|nr:hypothetical protein [Armatimonadia bacterium]